MTELFNVKPTVAVDLDGTLAEYDGWKGLNHIGDPKPGAQNFMRTLKEDFRVLIYTCRTNVHMQQSNNMVMRLSERGVAATYLKQLVEDWADKWDIPYDEVFAGQGKPVCLAYVDDRAIEFNGNWQECYDKIIQLQNKKRKKRIDEFKA